MYQQGRYPATPEGISNKQFHDTVREWYRIVQEAGPEALIHYGTNRQWTAEDRYELVARVLAGESIKSVAISKGINRGMLYQWIRKYKLEGYQGLAIIKRGRSAKETPMNKNKQKPKPLNESEREELIRLRAENEYIKAENEVIKKQIALRHEKQAALLKAKKQRSSKNSEKKATH